MPKRFKGFNRDEHTQAANAIRHLNQQMNLLATKIMKAYGVSGPVLRSMPNDPLAKLKNQMDEAYYREHGHIGPYYEHGPAIPLNGDEDHTNASTLWAPRLCCR